MAPAWNLILFHQVALKRTTVLMCCKGTPCDSVGGLGKGREEVIKSVVEAAITTLVYPLVVVEVIQFKTNT